MQSINESQAIEAKPFCSNSIHVCTFPQLKTRSFLSFSGCILNWENLADKVLSGLKAFLGPRIGHGNRPDALSVEPNAVFSFSSRRDAFPFFFPFLLSVFFLLHFGYVTRKRKSFDFTLLFRSRGFPFYFTVLFWPFRGAPKMQNGCLFYTHEIFFFFHTASENFRIYRLLVYIRLMEIFRFSRFS